MKKFRIIILVLLLGLTTKVNAQFVIGDLIRLTVTKVIKAIDLKVQRLQNKTIWLQNAQKTLENELSKYRLTEIAGWSDQQRALYAGYYKELWQVKSTITYYERIEQLTIGQVAMLNEYQQAWRLFQADKHFRPEELVEMERVYVGILDASAKNLDQVMMVVSPGTTQMTDQQRLEAINRAGDRLDENFSDLKEYNNQNMILSMQRSKDKNELETLKNYYGLH